MKSRMTLTLLVLFMTMALASCAGARGPMSASEARGMCMSYKDDPEDKCLDSNSVCDQYQQVMTAKHGSKAECRKACDNLRISLTSGMPGIGCGYISGKGWNSCATYCDTNY